MPTIINPSDQTITQYNVQSGGANNLLNNIVPSTAGFVLTSNGASSQPTFQAATGGGSLSASGTLTNSQIKNLHGTPVQAIAAPGSGKVIVVIQVIGKLNYGGTNVFTAGAGQQIGCFYGTAQSAIGANTTGYLLSNGNITSNSNKVSISCCTANATVAFDVGYSTIANTAINLYNFVATEISGNAGNDNTIGWQIEYFIATI
jgi:hypothetical protein